MGKHKLLIGKKLGFIGGGNMAEALMKGLLAKGILLENQIQVSDIKMERLSKLQSSFKISISTDNRKITRDCSAIILAVKPQHIQMVLEEIDPEIDETKVVISIAAGISINTIQNFLSKPARIIRVMPNTPALVFEGATGIAKSKNAQEADLELTLNIFQAVGKTVIVEETLLNAVTGLSGSGPAFVFTIIEALSDAGVKVGLPREISLLLASQTVLGSAKMVLETGQHPAQLKDSVTSPGGTTIAGLHALARGKLRATLMDAVEVATERAFQLDRSLRT